MADGGDNAELARRLFEAFRERDAETMRELIHPDGEFQSLVNELEGGSFKGHEGVMQYLDNIDETWGRWSTEDERFVEAGEDTVVCTYRVRGFGKGSDVPIDLEIALVWQLRDGRFYRGKSYLDLDEAFEAANASS